MNKRIRNNQLTLIACVWYYQWMITDVWLKLTFSKMPNVKEVLNNWLSKVTAFFGTVFSHPLCNSCMAVRNEWLDYHASAQKESECLFEREELHTRTATCLICLKVMKLFWLKQVIGTCYISRKYMQICTEWSCSAESTGSLSFVI